MRGIVVLTSCTWVPSKLRSHRWDEPVWTGNPDYTLGDASFPSGSQVVSI